MIELSDALLLRWRHGWRLPEGQWRLSKPVELGPTMSGAGPGCEVFVTQDGSFVATGVIPDIEFTGLRVVAKDKRTRPLFEVSNSRASIRGVTIEWRGVQDFFTRSASAMYFQSSEVSLTQVAVLGWPGQLGEGACVQMDGRGSALDARVCLFAPWMSSAVVLRGAHSVVLRHCTVAMNMAMAAVEMTPPMTEHVELVARATELVGDVSGALFGLCPPSRFNVDLDGCRLGKLDVIDDIQRRTLQQRGVLLSATATPGVVTSNGRPLVDHLRAMMTVSQIGRWDYSPASAPEAVFDRTAPETHHGWADLETTKVVHGDVFGRAWGKTTPVGALKATPS